jgi:hypothetical protein
METPQIEERPSGSEPQPIYAHSMPKIAIDWSLDSGGPPQEFSRREVSAVLGCDENGLLHASFRSVGSEGHDSNVQRYIAVRY